MADVRSLLNQEAQRVSAPPDAMEAALARGRRRRRMERVLTTAFALLVAVGGLAGAFVAFHQPGSARPASTGSRAQTRAVNPSSTQTRTVTVADATFTVSGSPSPSGFCLTVSGDGGNLGGCGTSEGAFRASEGGLNVHGQLYNVAYGQAPAGASSMEVVLGNGTTLRQDASKGVWIFAVAAKVGDRASDFVTVRAKDGAGNVLARVKLPSLAEARGHASGMKPSTGSG